MTLAACPALTLPLTMTAQLTHLPEDIQRGVYQSDNAWATAPCALLFRNMPVDPGLPPTPADGRAPGPGKRTFCSEAGLVGLTLLKGGVIYGSVFEKEGALIHQARSSSYYHHHAALHCVGQD